MSLPNPYIFQTTFVNVKVPSFKEVSECIDRLLSDYKRAVRSIGFIFVSDDEILAINKKHLNHDYFTDVITFPYGKNPIEAEIYISVDRIQENAKSFGVPFIEELTRVMIHGVLHLLGEKDDSLQNKKRMTSKENHYLSTVSFESIQEDYQAIWPLTE